MTYATLSSDLDKSTAALSLDVPQYCVWGAGTGIGKTLVSAGICHVLSQSEVSWFVVRFVVYEHDEDYPERRIVQTCSSFCTFKILKRSP
jgi:predicted GTPase